jgi:hypothetical protein
VTAVIDFAPAIDVLGTEDESSPFLRLDGIPNGIIGRLDDHSGYKDPATGIEYPSVTKTLGAAISKPWLAPWGAKSAATWAIEHLDDIADARRDGVPRADLIKLITAAAKQQREIKAEAGRYWHDVLECLILDAPFPALPEHLQGARFDGELVDFDQISTGLLNVLTDFRVKPLAAECTILNRTIGYAGTLDLIVQFFGMWLPMPDGRIVRDPIGLVDCKTGQHLEEAARAQMAAYRRAEVVLLPFGRECPVPQVDFTAILHLRGTYDSGYKLIRTDMDDEGHDLDGPAWDWFTTCVRQLAGQREQVQVRGYPIYPPTVDGGQPLPLLEDIVHPGLGRFVKPLARAGIRSLHDLTVFTGAELQGSSRKGHDKGVKGVGEKAIPVLRDVLAKWGMAFRDEEAPAVLRRPVLGLPSTLAYPTGDDDLAGVA